MQLPRSLKAGILISLKNAFATLFLINALLTLLFGYFLYVVSGNFTPQGVFYLGLIALIFGIVNELSAYLLSRIKAISFIILLSARTQSVIVSLRCTVACYK